MTSPIDTEKVLGYSDNVDDFIYCEEWNYAHCLLSFNLYTSFFTVACHCVFGTYFLGKIIRLVQEKYLRADVECGYLFGRIISQVN